MSRRRWPIWLAAAGALALIGGMGFLLIQDYSDHKAAFAEAGRGLIGRNVEIKGDIRLRLGFSPSLVMEDVTLANVEGARRPTMASFRRFEVAVDLFALFRGVVHVKRLTLIGGDVHLEIDKQGVGNWLIAGDAAQENAEPEEVVLPFSEFRVLDTDVTFRDHRSGRTEKIKIARFQGRVDGGADALEVDLLGTYRDRVLTASGSIGADIYREEPPTTFPVDLKISVAGATATAKGRIAVPLAGGGTDARIEIHGEDAKGLAALFGARPVATGPFNGEARLRAGKAHWTASGVKLQLGALDLTGSFRLDTAGKMPFLTANVETSPIDLDALESSAPVVRARKGRRWVFGGEPLPLDQIPAFEGAATVKTPALKLEGLAFTDVSFSVLLEKRVFMIRHLRARLLGGTARGDLMVNAQRPTATVGARLGLRNVDIGGLLTKLSISDTLTGRGDLSLRLNSAGNSLRKIAAAANGEFEMTVGKGHVKGSYVDLLGADLLRSVAPWAERIEDASVNCLVGLFRIERGVATSTGLLLDTNRVTIAGKGNIDLRAEEFDMKLMPRPKDPSLLSLAMPVDVTGPLTDPRLTPDELSVARNVASVVAGGLINPLIVLVPLVSPGAGEKNACVAALKKGVDKDKRAKSLPKYDDRPFIHRSIEDVSREVGRGITDLFGE